MDKIKFKRLNLLETALKKTVVYPKNTIQNSQRLCAICGRKLNQYDFHTDSYSCIVKHFHLHYSGGLLVNICYDINSCRKRLKGGTKDVFNLSNE